MTHDLEAIRARVGLEDLFRADDIALRPCGRQLKGLSPFNKEKTPSCYVDPVKGRFKCFSSGHSGSIFDYVMLTHGCDFPTAVAWLAARAGLSAQSTALPARVVPVRAKVEESKPLAALGGRDLVAWEEGVAFLVASAGDENSMAGSIARWRGFRTETVLEVARAGKMGVVRLSPWLLRQESAAAPGTRRVAFPVEGFLADGSPALLSYHVRLRPLRDEKKPGWRFVPSGVGAWPFLLGSLDEVRFFMICEGQWDALALFDAMECSYAELVASGIVIAGIRGASNWRLFAEHILMRGIAPDAIDEQAAKRNRKGAPPLRPELRALLFCDRDEAGAGWTTGSGDEATFCEVLQSVCGEVSVCEPKEALGKDVNDVLRLLNREVRT